MKSLLYLMTAVMAGFLNFSLTACSVDYDGNDYEAPEIIGTWDAVSNQYYAEGEGYSQPGLSTGYWVVTDRTITEYDKKDANAVTTAGLNGGNRYPFTVKQSIVRSSFGSAPSRCFSTSALRYSMASLASAKW